MKNYTITVNGVAYDVTVEENGAAPGPAPAPAPAPKTAPQAAAPAPAPAPKPAAKKKAAEGAKVTAGAAGKVFKIEAGEGTAVKKGDPVVVIEAMKMEIPMAAPADGTVASIEVAVGDMVEAGAVLAIIS